MLLENAAPVSACAVAGATNSMSSHNSELSQGCKLCVSSLVTSPNVSYGSTICEILTASTMFSALLPMHEVAAIGIGGSLATPPLPHHRTYGSVYGGSRG
jgi:hypothetical protein